MNQKTDNIFLQCDWAFLLFLVGATNVKLYFKVVAILFYLCYIIHKHYKVSGILGFTRFYLIMPVIGTIGSLWQGAFEVDSYWFGYLTGVTNWLLAAAITYLLYVAIINGSRRRLIATLKVFFLLNAIVSLAELGVMIINSGQLVPYWYWEPTEYYGGSTGDHIHGIMGNISVTNAALSSIGMLFFLYNKELKWSMLCLIILLLCTSNTALILSIITLAGVFVLGRKAYLRKNVLVLLLTVGIIYPVLSLDNIKYVDTIYDEEVSANEKVAVKKHQNIEDVNAVPQRDIANLNEQAASADPYYLNKTRYFKMPLNDTVLISYKDDLKYIQQFGTARSTSNDNLRLEPAMLRHILERWYGIPYEKLPLTEYAGNIKFYTMKQTRHYLLSSPKNLLAGAGIGNFSSKLAIKMTGLGLQGSYPVQYIYVGKDYLPYHLFSVLYLFSMPISEHSILNMTNSIYNQVAGEYGLLGMAAFALLYLAYIWKYRKRLKAGLFIVPLMLIFFGFEYWFEMISLTVIFELFTLMDIYQTENDVIGS